MTTIVHFFNRSLRNLNKKLTFLFQIKTECRYDLTLRLQHTLQLFTFTFSSSKYLFILQQISSSNYDQLEYIIQITIIEHLEEFLSFNNYFILLSMTKSDASVRISSLKCESNLFLKYYASIRNYKISQFFIHKFAYNN